MTKPPKHRINPNDDFQAAMRDLIGAGWNNVWLTMPTVETADDPETVHQIRVASRRLRAAMDVSVDLFPNGWFRRLHKDAKEMTGAFGAVRDIDVQMAELDLLRKRATPDEQAALNYLISNLEQQRTQAHVQMHTYIDGLQLARVQDRSRQYFPYEEPVVDVSGEEL